MLGSETFKGLLQAIINVQSTLLGSDTFKGLLQAIRTSKLHCLAVALKGMLQAYEGSYESALMKLNLQTLEQRRQGLCLNFAKNCIKNDKLTDLFPENENAHESRYPEKYRVLYANTERSRKSSVIYMQNLLNTDNRIQQQKLIKY